jgi:hypothetical protein
LLLCCLTALSLVWTSCPSPAPPCCSDDRRRSQPSTAPAPHHPYTQSADTGYLQGQHNTTRGFLFSADACRRRLSRACLGRDSVFSMKCAQKRRRFHTREDKVQGEGHLLQGNGDRCSSHKTKAHNHLSCLNFSAMVCPEPVLTKMVVLMQLKGEHQKKGGGRGGVFIYRASPPSWPTCGEDHQVGPAPLYHIEAHGVAAVVDRAVDEKQKRDLESALLRSRSDCEGENKNANTHAYIYI